MIDHSTESPQSTAAGAQELDAWSARFVREPIGQSQIDLICLSEGVSELPAATSSAAEVIRRKGRLGKLIPLILPEEGRSRGESLNSAFAQVSAPLFVISGTDAEWNRDILERMLKSVDHCDLVLGCRPCTPTAGRIARRIASLARGFFWGAGVLDPLTPYKLGRSDVFRKIPLQSASRFVEVELVAKANFLDALIDEIALPVASPWIPPRYGPESRADRRGLFRHPRFRHPVSETHETQDSTAGCTELPHGPESSPDTFIPKAAVPPEPNGDVRTPGNDG